MNTLIASPDITAKLLTMPEFRDAPAGLNFHGKGTMITPLGAKLIKSNDQHLITKSNKSLITDKK